MATQTQRWKHTAAHQMTLRYDMAVAGAAFARRKAIVIVT